MPPTTPGRVALVTLGCARNDVDSEELAARLTRDGWALVPDVADADVALVNTCGFVEAAKKESIDTLLAAAGPDAGAPAVVAVGCLAERYGADLAASLPEASVLGFDDYPDISARLRSILDGELQTPHPPRDRRTLLPLAPVERSTRTRVSRPDLPAGLGPASGPRPLRLRLGEGPTAPLKLASGCDRRCSFCAIPGFRGAFVSRPPNEVLAEAAWLAEQGVREVVLVSENSTSYGKDLGDLRLLESLLSAVAAVEGISRVRVSYLQPAELRPGLVEVIATTPGVAPYFDLSFQHASGPVLRRMRRFGDADRFLELVTSIRAANPSAGIRSNVIVGFPGETDADLAELERFLTDARLDAIGVFGYSDEDGTEAAALAGKLPGHEIADRVSALSRLTDELVDQRAAERVGEVVEVLIEEVDAVDGADDRVVVEGRAAHQGPEVDGSTTVRSNSMAVGDLAVLTVVESVGADLVAA